MHFRYAFMQILYLMHVTEYKRQTQNEINGDDDDVND